MRGLNTAPGGWQIFDCMNNYHITLDRGFFSMYAIEDTNIEFQTAIHNLRWLNTTYTVEHKS